MDDALMLWQAALQTQQTQQALQQMNDRVAGHGLTLRPEDIRWLTGQRQVHLQGSGRVEFGAGVLPKLLFAFCDSPYIHPADFAVTLDTLLACFYQLKNESMEAIPDDELVDFMKQHFDGSCHGSAELLTDACLEGLARGVRFGTGATSAEAPDTEEDSDDDE